MDLSVITVTHNNREYIGAQVFSVKNAAEGLVYEQIIKDNGSTDGTVKEIEELSRRPVGVGIPTGVPKQVRDSDRNIGGSGKIKIIADRNNIGFGAANNKAAEISSGEFLLFLNPDMRLEPNSLIKIVNWMRERPEVGIVSPKLTDELGLFNEDAKPRRFPGILDQLSIILKLHHIFPWLLNDYLYKGFEPDKEQEVDSVRGSFMLMRREIYKKLGWAFDPRYFIWFEDVDICREAKRLGYKVFYTPIISCVDYVGQSFKKKDGLWKQKKYTESMLRYFQKWEPWYKWMWVAIFRPVGIGLVYLKENLDKLKNN